MAKRILVLGGYGNFGSYICNRLSRELDLQIVIAGRSEEKCKEFISSLKNTPNRPEYFVLDFTEKLPAAFLEIGPDVVIHTVGPYQRQSYYVAESCIEYGCHYVDLADAREFVVGIRDLDGRAKQKGVSVISGASSLPCLSAAVIDQYKNQFRTINNIEYGISTAQQTNRGLATMQSVLSYTGKPFQTMIDGVELNVYGWQDLHFHKYPQLGWRALGNCDVPDLSVFPLYYPDIKSIQFSAGTELLFMHMGLWLLSWLVRIRVVTGLEKAASALIKIARLFDCLGSSESGFHMLLSGTDEDGHSHSIICYLIAKSGHGPYIPCAPSIILAKKLARGELKQIGAYPCVGIIDLPTYMDELKGLDIELLTI